jgi:hypothetical protein
MALSIARQEKLNQEDVVVISSNYTLPIPFGQVVPAFSEINRSWWAKFASFNVGKAFDFYVKGIIGTSKFTAYVDIMHTYQKLLVTHENCKAFHFFEEGTDSYMLPQSLEDFTRTAVSDQFRNRRYSNTLREVLRTLRGYTSALHSLPYHTQSYQYEKTRRYYCLSNHCYPEVNSEQKIQVKPNFNKDELNILSSSIQLNNAVIVVEETYPNKYGLTDEEYKRILGLAFKKLVIAKDNSEIYLKLRPAKKDLDSRLTRLLDELGFKFNIIPNNTLAEGLFINSQNLKVVGFVSSLLMYASIFGHNGYSMIHLMKNKQRTRFDSINGFDSLVYHLENTPVNNKN